MRFTTLFVLVLMFSTALMAQNVAESSTPAVQQVQTDSAGPNSGDVPSTQPEAVPPQAHPAATTYSDAYQTRLKIHKYASFATLPLFAAEVALGQSLYNNPNETGSKKALHGAVGTGIVGLFGVNTVTGVWNMWEGRHDTNGRKLKLAHGLLMMAADAGFVATVAITPHNSSRLPVINVQNNRALHRDLALGSVGVATVGYLMMLFGGH